MGVNQWASLKKKKKSDIEQGAVLEWCPSEREEVEDSAWVQVSCGQEPGHCAVVSRRHRCWWVGGRWWELWAFSSDFFGLLSWSRKLHFWVKMKETSVLGFEERRASEYCLGEWKEWFPNFDTLRKHLKDWLKHSHWASVGFPRSGVGLENFFLTSPRLTPRLLI